MTKQEAIFQLYEQRGDLLDMAAIAAINECPFYMQKELDCLNDQIKLLESAKPLKVTYKEIPFTDPRTPSQADLDRWQAESEDTYKSMRAF